MVQLNQLPNFTHLGVYIYSFIDFLKVLWFGDFRVSLVGSFSVLRFFWCIKHISLFL